ncbi:MAG: hypothetical protein GXP55_20135 [Deltaproteobacteria bacterium]|nr:hypothetical protein [Deltaproteobacteria bacterium]
MDGGAELVRTLVRLRREARSGSLTVDAGGVRTWVHLERGVPVFAEGGARRDDLGSVLRDEGLIDDLAFRAIVQRVTEGFVDNEAARFGEIAVSLGYVSEAQVNAALSAQLERKLLECMSHRAVESEFRDEEELDVTLSTYPCNIETLTLSAVGTVFDPPRVQTILSPYLLGYLRLEAPAKTVSERLGLDAEGARLLRAIDGARPTVEVMGATGMEPARATHLVTALLLLDLASAPPEPSRARMQREDTGRVELPHARDGVSVAAPASEHPQPAKRPRPSPEALRQRARLVAARLARHKPQRTVAPPVAPSPARHDTQDKRAAARARAAAIAERFERQHGLVPSAARHTTQPAMAAAIPDWQRDLEHGLELATQGAYVKAQALLAEVEAASAGDARARVSFARRFAEHQTLDDTRGQEVIGRGLMKEAKKLLRQDKHWAFAHFVLAKLRLADGDEEGAARSFKNAATLEPQNIHVQRYHRILQRRMKK